MRLESGGWTEGLSAATGGRENCEPARSLAETAMTVCVVGNRYYLKREATPLLFGHDRDCPSAEARVWGPGTESSRSSSSGPQRPGGLVALELHSDRGGGAAVTQAVGRGNGDDAGGGGGGGGGGAGRAGAAASRPLLVADAPGYHSPRLVLRAAGARSHTCFRAQPDRRQSWRRTGDYRDGGVAACVLRRASTGSSTRPFRQVI
jgi:hypothetical protein